MQVSAFVCAFRRANRAFPHGGGHCLASRALTRQFLRLFALLKEPRIFYLQIPYTKIPVIITTTF
ncbi:hypothetical protein EFT52_07140 [Lacticaseibacillus paracasei]|nr:hypothetical protein [Lacticaseibacillus paracasei]